MERQLPYPIARIARLGVSHRLVFGHSHWRLIGLGRKDFELPALLNARSNPTRPISAGGQVIRVDRATNGESIFSVSGVITTEDIPYLEQLLGSESDCSKIALDLKDVLHVNDAAVGFLLRCETSGIALRNCPAFIRDWMQIQKGRE